MTKNNEADTEITIKEKKIILKKKAKKNFQAAEVNLTDTSGVK